MSNWIKLLGGASLMNYEFSSERSGSQSMQPLTWFILMFLKALDGESRGRKRTTNRSFAAVM